MGDKDMVHKDHAPAPMKDFDYVQVHAILDAAYKEYLAKYVDIMPTKKGMKKFLRVARMRDKLVPHVVQYHAKNIETKPGAHPAIKLSKNEHVVLQDIVMMVEGDLFMDMSSNLPNPVKVHLMNLIQESVTKLWNCIKFMDDDNYTEEFET